MMIARVGYVLIMTLCGLLYFYQHAIEIYWQQTYHSASPLTTLKTALVGHQRDWLTYGEQVTKSLTQESEKREAYFANWNQQAIDDFNQWLGLSRLESTQTVASSELNQHKPLRYEVLHENTDKPVLTVTPAVNSTTAVKEPVVTLTKPSVTSQPKSSEQQTIFSQMKPLVNTPLTIEVKTGDKLFFVGDSLMQGVAPRVKRSLYNNYKIEGIDLSKQSTGLAYPKAFDWPKVIEETLDNQPDIRVMMVFLGPNDPWHFPVADRKEYLKFKSIEWENTYRSRIERILVAAKNHDVQVIWLGVPCMRKTKLHQDMLYLNTLYRSEAEKFGAHYIPTSELLGCSDDKYMNFVKTDHGNVKVRIDDGIHFTVPGQRILAERVIAELTILPSAEEEKHE